MINYKTLTATTFAIATLSLTGCNAVDINPDLERTVYTAESEVASNIFANNVSVGEVKGFKTLEDHEAERKIVVELGPENFKSVLASSLESAGYLGDNDAEYVINAQNLYQNAGEVHTFNQFWALGVGTAERDLMVRYEVVEKATGDVEHVAYVDSNGSASCADNCFLETVQERTAVERAYNSNFEALIKDLNS